MPGMICSYTAKSRAISSIMRARAAILGVGEAAAVAAVLVAMMMTMMVVAAAARVAAHDATVVADAGVDARRAARPAPTVPHARIRGPR